MTEEATRPRGRPRIHPEGYDRRPYLRDWWRRNGEGVNHRRRVRYYQDAEYREHEKERHRHKAEDMI